MVERKDMGQFWFHVVARQFNEIFPELKEEVKIE
jgi:hypothetical protein